MAKSNNSVTYHCIKMGKLQDINMNINLFNPATNETYVGTMDILGIQGSKSPNISAANIHTNPGGEMLYIFVVLGVYSISICCLIVSRLSKTRKQYSLDAQMRLAEKYYKEIPSVREKGARDSYKELKRSLVPVVAKSGARDLLSRRKSFMPILDEFRDYRPNTSSARGSIVSSLSHVRLPLHSIAESDEKCESNISTNVDVHNLPTLTKNSSLTIETESYPRRPSSSGIGRSIDSISLNSWHNVSQIDDNHSKDALYGDEIRLSVPNGEVSGHTATEHAWPSPGVKRVTFGSASDVPLERVHGPPNYYNTSPVIGRKYRYESKLTTQEQKVAESAVADQSAWNAHQSVNRTVNQKGHAKNSLDGANHIEEIGVVDQSNTTCQRTYVPVDSSLSTGCPYLPMGSMDIDELKVSIDDSEEELSETLTSAYEMY